jgi:Putative DNA-binding domain
MRRFPATGWLLGTSLVEEAVRYFIREHPPSAPCLAEYGEGLPQFLATWPGAERVPCLHEFTDLDWHLGRLAVSVDLPAITRSDCAAIAPCELADAVVGIQPGTHYTRSTWPIDELMTMYLRDAAPNRLTVIATEVWIEARGGRGSLRLARLTAAEFSFRVALFEGLPIEAAAERAMRSDEAFDPGAALVALVDAGLATSIEKSPIAERP